MSDLTPQQEQELIVQLEAVLNFREQQKRSKQPVRNQITEPPVRNCKCDAVDDPNDYYPDPPVINWSEDSAFNQSPSPQSNPAPSSPELIYNSNPNDEDDYYPDPPIINWAAESEFRP
ncbi:hypothetical protein [Thalassoroseus pseudoceratinae]|uniref:hypothetical protein n=1 Tax=Thalassoroseus pseudoceratinae TaxID=2713176 RepID=UPI0014208A30|nr:hypothetical protein [Thalassoroseus pseudoceratinae]